MKDLLEKLDGIFAGEPKQKRGDQVKGKEKFDMISPVLGADYKKHPASGRLVGAGGAAEELEETLEELAERLRKELEEYGASGTAISGGDDDSREQVAAYRRNIQAQKNQMDAQKDNLEKQETYLKRQMLDIKRQPEPIPNPNDVASVMQYGEFKRQKRDQLKQMAQQLKQLGQQKAQF